MTIQEVWERVVANWGWIHFLLLGLMTGSSFGLWAYRDLWYGNSTFLHGPAVSSSFFGLLRQWFSATILEVPAALGIALFITTPLVFQKIDSDSTRVGVLAATGGIWLLLRIFFLFVMARGHQPEVPGVPGFLPNPVRWARYHSASSPDRLLSNKVDSFLGLVLHVGLAVGWYQLHHTGRTDAWWTTAGVAASIAWCLVLTTISVLIHPRSVSHEKQAVPPPPTMPS